MRKLNACMKYNICLTKQGNFKYKKQIKREKSKNDNDKMEKCASCEYARTV